MTINVAAILIIFSILATAVSLLAPRSISRGRRHLLFIVMFAVFGLINARNTPCTKPFLREGLLYDTCVVGWPTFISSHISQTATRWLARIVISGDEERDFSSRVVRIAVFLKMFYGLPALLLCIIIEGALGWLFSLIVLRAMLPGTSSTGLALRIGAISLAMLFASFYPMISMTEPLMRH